jgi:Zn-finger nucleic acid-binding protein
VLSERQGIEIDYCPNCRGVWLDRGELDKIVQRAAASALDEVESERREWAMAAERSRQPDRRDDRRDDDRHGYKPRKKKSFLSEVFDF